MKKLKYNSDGTPRSCEHASIVYPFGTIERIPVGSYRCAHCPCFGGRVFSHDDQEAVDCMYEEMATSRKA